MVLGFEFDPSSQTIVPGATTIKSVVEPSQTTVSLPRLNLGNALIFIGVTKESGQKLS